jgi:hypothetical protein
MSLMKHDRKHILSHYSDSPTTKPSSLFLLRVSNFLWLLFSLSLPNTTETMPSEALDNASLFALPFSRASPHAVHFKWTSSNSNLSLRGPMLIVHLFKNYHLVTPPSTTISSPVMYELASLARNTIGPLKSSTSATRFNMMSPFHSCTNVKDANNCKHAMTLPLASGETAPSFPFGCS